MKKHLEKAKVFLDSGDKEDLIHACLELRMAIEHHVYGKLRYFSEKHGPELLYRSWQPYRALELLSQLEPMGDKSYTLSFAEKDSLGNPNKEYKQVGKHEALSARWTKKYYNKLGSFLHLELGSGDVLNVNKEDLEPIYHELLRVSKGNLIMDFSGTVYFECQLCKSKITTCVEAVPELDLVYCPNTGCNATYLAEYREDKWQFIINATNFECAECKNKQPVLENELKIGTRIRCNKCKTRYVIAKHHYELQKYQS